MDNKKIKKAIKDIGLVVLSIGVFVVVFVTTIVSTIIYQIGRCIYISFVVAIGSMVWILGEKYSEKERHNIRRQRKRTRH